MRRKAKGILQGGGINHPLQEEKAVYHELRKLAEQKTRATCALRTWAETQDNEAIKDTFEKLAEVDRTWAEVQQDFAEKYLVYRRTFKEIKDQDKAMQQTRRTGTSARHLRGSGSS